MGSSLTSNSISLCPRQLDYAPNNSPIGRLQFAHLGEAHQASLENILFKLGKVPMRWLHLVVRAPPDEALVVENILLPGLIIAHIDSVI